MFHILVADDDKNTRLLFKAVLEREGYTVSTAINGEEALAILDREHIDLVVMDIMMPKMDGYEFTRLVRESEDNLPILMISAKQLPADKHKGFLVGTDDYIPSPWMKRKCFTASKHFYAGRRLPMNGGLLLARWCWIMTQ